MGTVRGTIVLVFLIVAFVVVNGSIWTLREGEQALITQFGEVQGDPITKAGLHFKLPFIQDVRRFEKRIMSWDGDPEQIPTKDKKFIWVDVTARWRIKDLKTFAERAVDVRSAHSRLDDILDGVTRDVVSSHNLVEAVRNSNAILERFEELQQLAAKAEELEGADSLAAAEAAEEITRDLEPVKLGREKLSRLILQGAQKELATLGVELIDVQIRRIAYEASVEQKVYERMISERKRIAERIRSFGKGEEAKIRGKLNLDLKRIESEAYRTAREIRGRAEGEANAIYATTLKQDPEYYQFYRTLEAYKKSIPEKGRLILSTDSDFLKLLEKRP